VAGKVHAAVARRALERFERSLVGGKVALKRPSVEFFVVEII
jgi:hypothetical protein